MKDWEDKLAYYGKAHRDAQEGEPTSGEVQVYLSPKRYVGMVTPGAESRARNPKPVPGATDLEPGTLNVRLEAELDGEWWGLRPCEVNTIERIRDDLPGLRAWLVRGPDEPVVPRFVELVSTYHLRDALDKPAGPYPTFPIEITVEG